MFSSVLARLAIVFVILGLTAGCANTIRGMGQDTAAAVDATQAAGQDVEAATY